LFWLLACSGTDAKNDSVQQDSSAGTVDSADSGDTSSTTDTVDTGECDLSVDPPASQDPGKAPVAARELVGTIVWTADFDADAEALGMKDCSYTRVYDGTERNDQGYLCPGCSLLVPANAEMTVGYEDCYKQIGSQSQVHTETLGVGDVSGELHFFRTSAQNATPGDMGAITGDLSSFSFVHEDTSDLTAGGKMTLSLAGSFSTTVGSTMMDDPQAARTEDYSCGWPHNNPGGPNSSYTLGEGEVFPNVQLEDQCGEMVSLWDFRGYYTIVDISAINCGYCQVMAQGAETFKSKMDDACIPVELVTLMADSLSTVNLPATLEDRKLWASTYGLTSPVLGDEGFGYALLPSYVGEDNFGYPTTAVLDPEGRLIGTMDGFATDGWDTIEAMIEADWATR
jgi:hypothetical protein